MIFPPWNSPINLPCNSSTSSHVPGTRARRCAIRAYACGATVLVNMRDIEALKEDDGFEGAFLSP